MRRFFFLFIIVILSFSGCQMPEQAQQNSNAQNTDKQNTIQDMQTKPQELTRIPLSIQTQNGSHSFSVEVAKTKAELEHGLMFRTHLPEKDGMLFVFEEPKIVHFWMKNTLIPLDIIFIDENFRIIDIFKNLQPCQSEDCPTVKPQVPTKYVLEINGNRSSDLGISVGDRVDFEM